MLRLADFDYHLPDELIAQYPMPERDQARLLVLDRMTGDIEHRSFRDIGDYFKPADVLALNNTKVLPARIKGKRLTGGKVEALLLARTERGTYQALLKPARLKVGEKILLQGEKNSGVVVGRNEIEFVLGSAASIYDLGVMPLPPYIKRDAESLDNQYYQTVYAQEEGAIASPTAGLHFTEPLLARLKGQGVHIAFLTLHVGLGTFKPVVSEDIRAHSMQREYFNVPAKTAAYIQEAKRNGRRVFAVGTTTLRALEAAASGVRAGMTDLFIYPGYQFKAADCLITNFHLPKTTLFMLVCAFAGDDLAKKAYREAVSRKYRFYSYGDAMLVI